MINKIFKEEKFWISVILLVSLLIYSSFLLFNPVTLWDENVYLGNARSHIGISHFTEDFRFPLLEFVISGVWLITGESLLIARIILILFSLGSVFAFYLLTKEIFSKSILRLISTTLFAISPLMIYWSFRIYTDVPALCCMLLSIWLFFKFLKSKRNGFIFGSGILASLSFLFRFPVVLFAIIIGIFLLINKKIKSSFIFVGGAVITLIPWMIYNFVKYNNPLWDLLEQGKVVAEYTSSEPISLFLTHILSSLGLVLIGLIPFFWWLFAERKRKRFFANKTNLYLSLAILLLELVFYLFFVRLKLSRYVLVIVPFLILLSVSGTFWFANRFKKHTNKILTIIFIIFILQVLILSLGTIKTIHQQDFCKRPIYDASMFLKENYPSEETIISNSWSWFGYYNNYQVSSTWSSDVDLLLDKINPNLIILNKWGLEVNKESFFNNTRLQKMISFRNSCGDEVIILKVIK